MKVFSKRKYIENQTQEEYLEDKAWVDFCDGKKLTKEFEDGDGMIMDFFIGKEWMEEIES